MNALVSATAVAAATPIAAVAASVQHDPIFELIERHKAAFLRSQEAGIVQINTVDAPWSPDYDAQVHAAVTATANATFAAAADAAMALVETRPTTLAGLLALLAYVEWFNNGGLELASEPEHWYSMPWCWPAMPGENDCDLFGFAMLGNARRALQVLNGMAPSPETVSSLLESAGEEDVEPAAAAPKADPDAHVFKAIERHRKAEKHLVAVIHDDGVVDQSSDFGRRHTPESRRQKRNVQQRLDRAHKRETKAWLAMLETEPNTAVGKSTLVGYVIERIEKDRGDMDGYDLMLFLANVHRMVTPPWLRRLAAAEQGKATT